MDRRNDLGLNLIGYNAGYNAGASGGGGGGGDDEKLSPKSLAEYVDNDLSKLARIMFKNIRQECNTPVALFNEPKTLYTPNKDYKTYLIRKNSSNGTWKIFWVPTDFVFGANGNVQLCEGLICSGKDISIGTHYISTDSSKNNAWYYYFGGSSTLFTHYSSNDYNTLDEALAAICSNTTQYNGLYTTYAFGGIDLSVDKPITNSVVIKPASINKTFSYEIDEVSKNETIEVIS